MGETYVASSKSKGEQRCHQEHEAPTPQQQQLEALGQAHPCGRDHVKASRSEKTPSSAPRWPHQHHQTQHQQPHTATTTIINGLRDDASRENVLSTQHRHPILQAGSKVFTRRPHCRCWSSTTAPPARKTATKSHRCRRHRQSRCKVFTHS